MYSWLGQMSIKLAIFYISQNRKTAENVFSSNNRVDGASPEIDSIAPPEKLRLLHSAE